jgi:hypothetical protein
MRRRWRSLVVITLLVGVVGAIVLATAAGARRSSSSLQRFIEYSRSADVEVDARNPTPAQLDAFQHAPGVAGFAVLNADSLTPDIGSNLAIAAAVDDKFGSVADRARLVSGRRADPSAPDEINIGETLAAQAHLRIGSYIEAGSMTPAQLKGLLRGRDPGPPQGPRVRLRVVGIVRRPLDLGDRAASGGVVVLTPAFDHAYAGKIGVFQSVLRVRTVHGAADVKRVQDEARRIFGRNQFFQLVDASLERSGASSAINVLTMALWIFAAVTGLAAAVALGIVLTRDNSEGSGDQETLCALGLTRRQRVEARAPRALLIAAVGALLAVGGAVALSPLFPVGIAQRADPDTGLHADWLVLGLGLLVIVVFVVAVSMSAALRATRRAALEGPARVRGPGWAVAEIASSASIPPTVAIGVRMAVQRGRGKTAVPVLSAFLGVVLGVIGITGVLVFASSLNRLETTPRLYGWTWDFKAPDNTFTNLCQDGSHPNADFGLEKQAGVTDVGAVCYQSLDVDGRPVTGWGFFDLRGRIPPAIIEGHAPGTADEVALGTLTLRALHKSIGDIVNVNASGKSHSYRVVGRAVFPRMINADPQPLADGAAFTGAGLAHVLSRDDTTRYLLGRFAPGVNRAEVEHRVGEIKQFQLPPGEPAFQSDSGASGPAVPPEIDRLRHIDWFLPSLAILLTTLALIAVGHALVTSVRRRRRDLAMLKTLGFDRRQVRAAVAWQATTLVVVGLVVGIPIGLLVGTYSWRLAADGIGVSTTGVIPVVLLAAMSGGALVLVNLIAFVPARSAARTRPAVALQAE